MQKMIKGVNYPTMTKMKSILSLLVLSSSKGSTNNPDSKLTQEVYNASNVLIKSTDYIGEYIYENNVLKIIQHAEGRVLPDGANWEYQYNLKDHLGNVRVTFTTKTLPVTSSTTNFESATNTDFLNYNNHTLDLVDHTDAGTVHTNVQILNGGPSSRVGVAKTFSVLPGDLISASAYVKYRNLSATANINGLIASLSAAFGVTSSSVGDQLKIYNTLNNYSGFVAGGEHNNDDDAAPKGFVTILFFDKNYNFLDAAWDQVSTAGEQTSPTVKQPHDLVTISAKAPEAGYAYVFVSNEHPTFVDIYFDDVTFSNTPCPIVSTDDYYPFGLTFNSYQRENSVPNKFKFGGKEEQTDLDLTTIDWGWR
jgi:hypothetical protein